MCFKDDGRGRVKEEGVGALGAGDASVKGRDGHGLGNSLRGVFPRRVEALSDCGAFAKPVVGVSHLCKEGWVESNHVHIGTPASRCRCTRKHGRKQSVKFCDSVTQAQDNVSAPRRPNSLCISLEICVLAERGGNQRIFPKRCGALEHLGVHERVRLQDLECIDCVTRSGMQARDQGNGTAMVRQREKLTRSNCPPS